MIGLGELETVEGEHENINRCEHNRVLYLPFCDEQTVVSYCSLQGFTGISRLPKATGKGSNLERHWDQHKPQVHGHT